jgi:hypothetical protein
MAGDRMNYWSVAGNGDMPFLQGETRRSTASGRVDILARPGPRPCCDPPIEVTAACARPLRVRHDTRWRQSYKRPINPIMHGGRSMSTNMVTGRPRRGCHSHDGPHGPLLTVHHLRCPQIETAAYVGTGRRSACWSLCSSSTRPDPTRVGRLCQRHHQALPDRQGGPATSASSAAHGAALRLPWQTRSSSLRWTCTSGNPGQHQLRARSTPEYNVDYQAYLINRMPPDARLRRGRGCGAHDCRNAWRRPSAPQARSTGSKRGSCGPC